MNNWRENPPTLYEKRGRLIETNVQEWFDMKFWPIIRLSLSIFFLGIIGLILMQYFFDNIFNNILIITIVITILHLVLNNLLKSKFDISLILLISLIFFTITSLPLVNVDRSRSIYVLSWINEGKIKINNNVIDLAQVESKEKLNIDGVRQRINEQTERGLVIQDGNRLELSKSGQVIIIISKYVAKIFNLNGWEKNNL